MRHVKGGEEGRILWMPMEDKEVEKNDRDWGKGWGGRSTWLCSQVERDISTHRLFSINYKNET